MPLYHAFFSLKRGHHFSYGDIVIAYGRGFAIAGTVAQAKGSDECRLEFFCSVVGDERIFESQLKRIKF
jgi:hypothetical protein